MPEQRACRATSGQEAREERPQKPDPARAAAAAVCFHSSWKPESANETGRSFCSDPTRFVSQSRSSRFTRTPHYAMRVKNGACWRIRLASFGVR